MSLALGTRVGSFEIKGSLGAGGMGEVYRAHDTRLGRDVAIKILPAAFSGDAQYMARFEREARTLAALNHPNIATVYGVEQGALVMELAEGPTLADRIAQGAIPLDEALPIAKQITEGLEAAHERGIIHRDLKPANIKITPQGTVKLLDFGLAKAAQENGAAASAPNSISPTLSLAMTQAGYILGTAAYMSPEQARGKPVDKRADIWAFGCVLFEMLTGTAAFPGETVTDILAAVVRHEPPLDALPAQVRRVVARCLEKNPANRYRDIGDVRLDMLSPAELLPAAAPAQAPRYRWLWPGLTALGFLAAAVLTAIHFTATPPAPETMRFEIAPPAGHQLSNHLSISPDGRHLAFIATGADGIARLFVRGMDSTQARALPGTEGANLCFWSPDSRQVAFVAPGGVRRISLAGAAAKLIAPPVGSVTLGGTWNREGVILLAGGSTTLVRVPESGGTPETISNAGNSGSWPVFLPDDRHFLYLALPSTGYERRGLHLAELTPERKMRTLRYLTDSSTGGAVFSAGPNGPVWILFLRDGHLYARPFDMRRLDFSGEEVTVAEEVSRYLTRGFFSASGSGALIYATGAAERSNLVWSDRAGKTTGKIEWNGEAGVMALSPDSKSLAMSSIENGNADIWVLDLTRGSRVRLTFDPSSETSPVWTRDGEWVTYSAMRGQKRVIARKRANGSGEEEILFSGDSFVFPSDYSPDGRFLIYWQTVPGTSSDLMLLPLQGDDRKPIAWQQSPADEVQAVFSPDGRYVAYAHMQEGRTDVVARDFPSGGGRWQISTGSGSFPRWSADGREIYYVDDAGRLVAVPLAPGPRLQPGTPKVLFDASLASSQRWSYRYGALPGGQRFLLNRRISGDRSPSLTLILNWRPGAQ